jgi:hypothetical protein
MNQGIARIDSDPPPPGGEGEYDAPTKVGPMSAVAVAKMMKEAESHAVNEAGPRSGVRPSWPGLQAKDDGHEMPVLGFEEEPLEPTVVNPLASPPDLVEAIVTLEDADLEVQAPSLPPPLPKKVATSVPATNSARWQPPRRAAFPEWIDRIAEPVVRNDRRRGLLIAAGGCVAILALIVWWLCG